MIEKTDLTKDNGEEVSYLDSTFSITRIIHGPPVFFVKSEKTEK